MPNIGGLIIPEGAMPTMGAGAGARPALGDIVSSAAANTVGQVRYGVPYALRKVTGTLRPEDEQAYQRGLRDTAVASSQAAPAALSDLTGGKVGFGRFVAENFAASLPYMVGGAVGAAGGYATGGARGAIAGAIAGGSPQFAGSNVSRAVEEQGSLSTKGAAESLAFSPVQAGADALVGRFLPGMGKVIGDLASTQSGNFLRRTAVAMAKAGGTEAVTEAGQQVLERKAAGIPVGDADAAAEYVNAAVTAFALGGVMGAGGGFRRTNAIAKPVDMVTNEDMEEHITLALNGSLRAQLPPPEQFGRSSNPEQEEQTPQLPGPPDIIGGADGVNRVNPNGTVVQALPAPPAAPEPGLEEFPAGVQGMVRSVTDPSITPPLTAGTSLSRGLGAVEGFEPVAAPAAVEPVAAPTRAAMGVPEAPFADTLAEATKGLRSNQWLKKLEATDEFDLFGKVYDQVFTEQDTRAGTVELAKRLGVMDEAGNAGPVGQEVEARRAVATGGMATGETSTGGVANPAPPIPSITTTDPDSSPTQVKELAKSALTNVSEAPISVAPPTAEDIAETATAMKAAGITSPKYDGRALNSSADVFNALADDRVAKRPGESSKLEGWAKRLGLITNDDAMDVTPKGRKVYLQSERGIEATTSAAADAGFAGAAASQFDRGARAQIDGQEQKTFSGFEEMAAYNAGKVWARDFVDNGEVRTAEQTRGIVDRQAARATGKAVPRKSVERAPLTPDQVKQQALNQLIDSVDLRTVNDSDVAMLRRRVRDGDITPTELGDSIQSLQGGKTLFREPARTETPVAFPSMDEEADAVIKRRRRVRDKLMLEGARLTQAQQELLNRGPSKAQARAETEAATRTFELRNLIQFALSEKAINQERANRLNGFLDQGNVAAVEKSLKNFMAEANAGELTTGLADSAFEQWISGKDFMGALDHMVSHGPSAYHREIMKQVRTLAQNMQKQGVTLQLNIVRPGDMVPRALLGETTRALTTITRNPNVATVWLKSIEMGGSSGMNYQLAAHEMIHAVTMAIVQRGNRTDIFGSTKLGKAVADLYELQQAIADHFNARVAAGNLNEFEQAWYKRDNNSLANVDEILAWGLTNPEMQRYLSGIQYKPKESVFARLVSLLRDLLGLDAKYDTALTELLRVSEQLMGTDALDLESTFPRNNPDLLDMAALQAKAEEGGASAANRTAPAANEAVKTFVGRAGEAIDKMAPDAFQSARRMKLRWISHNQINRRFGNIMPGLLKHTEAHRWRDAVRANFSAMGDDVFQGFEKLEREKPKHAEMVGQLMATTTEFQVDPDRKWEDHKHIPTGRTVTAGVERVNARVAADHARIKTMYDAAVKLKENLRRSAMPNDPDPGAGYRLFTQFRAFNESQNFARLSAQLHNLVAMDRELMLGVNDATLNPTEDFLNKQAQISERAARLGVSKAEAIREWWENALTAQIAATTKFVNDKRGSVAGEDASTIKGMQTHLSPIELQLGAIAEAMAGSKKAPYFHLGRFGDYFGAAKVRTNADGTVNQESMQRVVAALGAAGFDDVQFSPANKMAKISLRFETANQTKLFEKTMRELHAAGALEGPLKTAVSSGARSRENNFGQTDGFPAFVQNYVEALESSPLYAPAADATPDEKMALARRKDEAVRLALDTWLEAQPDSAVSKVLAKRYTVPGYKKDMIRNYAHRWRVGAISLANVASAPRFAEAFTDMRGEVEAAKAGDSNADQFLLNDLYSEMKQRDQATPLNDDIDNFDKLRAISHSYFLGLSPAYAFINMTQMGVVALPELAKKHGYSKSFRAMRGASVDATAILKAAFNEAVALGPANWANVAITESVLTKAGLSPEKARFAMRMIASGTIDIGSQARALGQISEGRVGSTMDKTLQYASALGMYSETFSRLTVALAANELNPGDLNSSAKYATEVVSESMFDYQSWNTARALGKQGVLGPVTPIVAQFMSYSVQMLEKLLSEFTAAAGRPRLGDTPAQTAERKLEARRFLAGHLTAIVALTGTLGLPFMTVFAALLERTVDGLDDDEEPFDITAAYRGMLADVFGTGVAEVVSRGVPRAFGMDLSARAGEQNLIPTSEFWADRRPWKEALEANVGRSLGAVPSMITNIISGGGKIADGDYLQGLKEALPVGFKGPLEFYRMAGDGYYDSKGNKLPMTPGAAAMAWQLLGFTPAEKAEYSEVRGDLASTKGELARRSGKLRNNIVRALMEGDNATATELIKEAQAFDADNPGTDLVQSIQGAYRRRMMSTITAGATATPLGVSMNDIAGQNTARYANIQYGN